MTSAFNYYSYLLHFNYILYNTIYYLLYTMLLYGPLSFCKAPGCSSKQPPPAALDKWHFWSLTKLESSWVQRSGGSRQSQVLDS